MFPGGYEYRMHWEMRHFYPYLKRGSFDFNQAIWAAIRDKNIDRLIKEISDTL
tara:strand:+ start:923 stop:1081 length:159 start_codon:yes stop_codon:yes gene_type:complete